MECPGGSPRALGSAFLVPVVRQSVLAEVGSAFSRSDDVISENVAFRAVARPGRRQVCKKYVRFEQNLNRVDVDVTLMLFFGEREKDTILDAYKTIQCVP